MIGLRAVDVLRMWEVRLVTAHSHPRVRLASPFRQKGQMGGYGSGRRRSLDRHRQVESCLALDVDRIPRPILAGNEGHIDLTLPLTPNFVRCSYLVRCDPWGFELVLWMPATGWVVSRVRLHHVPAKFGGARPYLLCPSCRARGRKLYWPLEGPGGFGCRRCHQLSYRSSQERRFDLAKTTAHVYRPRKPIPSVKAMHRRYDRLRARAAATLAAAAGPAGRAST
jgi:hypothetical protein